MWGMLLRLWDCIAGLAGTQHVESLLVAQVISMACYPYVFQIGLVSDHPWTRARLGLLVSVLIKGVMLEVRQRLGDVGGYHRHSERSSFLVASLTSRNVMKPPMGICAGMVWGYL